ncbi:tetratricopeptide repeat protein [Kitasatospora viridis]|uniref:tetratricopeptide repeat protein n=1 Tax=Kitasatospora viridis TaxID=281105 RepID=UPI001478B14A|nr:tetratricopeptide repeat protein [Kitasatospora viridis]
MLTSAHVTGPVGSRVEAFHPGGTGSADATVVWCGAPGGRDDAALVLVGESEQWRAPTAPVRWGRLVTDRTGTPCDTWGLPDEAQRPGRAVEAAQLRGEVNPGSGFVGNQYVMDLAQHPPAADGASPWGGLSGGAVCADRLLIGVVAADRARSGHGRLNVLPAYVLHHDPGFRAALAEHGAAAGGGLEAVEFQDLADPAQALAGSRAPATPAALLEAGRRAVPFHGRDELVAELADWCRAGGFGAWLLHGPGGQGKTRTAHQLADVLAEDGWAVLWPRATATARQLAELRHAARPLLVVLDYAETRADQLTALVEAAAEHPGSAPLKLLLLARTDGDWWAEARTATRLAEDLFAGARTHRLTPLEPDPALRAGHYRAAVRALAGRLPLVDGLGVHDWGSAVDALAPRQLDDDAYGNALTLQMTALADLLDTVAGGRVTAGQEAEGVEDRLLGHEHRYWRADADAEARGLRPALSTATLATAVAAAQLAGAADREQADRLWQRLPALADQPRDRRDQVTAWLAALYPNATGAPWGALQPDRLAERHIGRALETDPGLADQLLGGADARQQAQLLTGYSRAAAHPVFAGRLDARLTELCLRHHERLAAQIIATATHTGHPEPLITALDRLVEAPDTSVEHLGELSDLIPRRSRRLADTALRLGEALVRRHLALAGAEPGTHLPELATSLNNLAVRLTEAGRWAEARARAEGAVAIHLAQPSSGEQLPDLAMSLNNLSAQLATVGRWAEGLAVAEQATGHYRALAQATPAAYLPGLAMSLNNLSNRLSAAGRVGEGLAAIEEAVAIRRVLAEAGTDAHLSNLCNSLNNLSVRLAEAGRVGEGLAAIEEAVAIRRTLARASPDAYLPDLALALSNLANRLDEVGRPVDGLAAIEEAVDLYRTLARQSPDAHLPLLAGCLNNLAIKAREAGRGPTGLAAIGEAVDCYRRLLPVNPDAYLSRLADALNDLSVHLGEADRRAEGLVAIEEAVQHFRVVAREDPAAHLPKLANALFNSTIDLVESGRWAEGRAALAEAVQHYRTLVLADPGEYQAALEQALLLDAWLRQNGP